jgi:hypothetical protein
MDDKFAWVAQAADPEHYMEPRRYVNVNESWIIASGDTILHAARNTDDLEPGYYHPETGILARSTENRSTVALNIEMAAEAVEQIIRESSRIDDRVRLGLEPSTVELGDAKYDWSLYNRAIRYKSNDFILRGVYGCLVIAYDDAIASIAPIG